MSMLTELNTDGHMRNIDVDNQGIARPRKGWKTFAGMVWQLWLINKRFNKMGIVGDFNIRLPLPPGGYKDRTTSKRTAGIDSGGE